MEAKKYSSVEQRGPAAHAETHVCVLSCNAEFAEKFTEEWVVLRIVHNKSGVDAIGRAVNNDRNGIGVPPQAIIGFKECYLVIVG